MKLILDLLGPPRLMGARQRHELRSGSLAIGRSPEADWVIPDIDRLISRRHLRVDASHGDFVLTDTSANGVYVNGSKEPLGYGASVKLRDGDRFYIGEAQIAVTIEPTAEANGPEESDPFDAARRRPVLRGSNDPLGGPFGAGLTNAASTPADIGPPTGPQSAAIDANWMNEPLERPALSEARPAHEFVAVVHRSGRQPFPTPVRAVANNVSSTMSMLELVELHHDLSLRKLAAALDAAAQTIDPDVWLDFRKKINHLVRKNVQ